ncbi:unnamed protein product [Cylicocyclus nassatus]|uniref:Uncharacterized protein n=1 Tax=Cylicocyclus nassatus TaxID=53992 RepID=A0AA36HIF0_CYLNA|nr:unnamed protein product [Cylicocyclus nassatus]
MGKQNLKEKELEFYRVQDHWLEHKDKESWDQMWMFVQRAVEAAIKQKLHGVVRRDVDDLVMTATVNIMARYKRPQGYKIEYLLTTARFGAIGVLYNSKQKQIDQETSYEAWTTYQLKQENTDKKLDMIRELIDDGYLSKDLSVLDNNKLAASEAADAIRELEQRVSVLESELKDRDERLKKARKIAKEIKKTSDLIQKEVKTGEKK